MKYAALITGSVKRIGKEIAYFLARQGYDIALHYNSSDTEALEVKDKILSLNIQSEIFRCDFENEKQVQNLLNNVLKKFPHLNLLINNASIFEKAPIQETTILQLKRHFAINFQAPYILSKNFAQRLKQGNIINMLDTKIATAKNTHSAYLLSKKALADFTLMAAREFAPHTRVNAIAPGIISGFPPPGKTESYLDKLKTKNLLKKKGNIDHILQTIEFILKNDFINGEIIYVDGGENLYL